MPEWLSASSRTLSCHLQLTGTVGPQPTRLWRSVLLYPLTTSFPITVHSASFPQFRAVLCLFKVMSLQTHPRMPLGPLYSSSVIMEGNFQEILSSLAFKMAAGLDLCLLVVEVALEIALYHVITIGVASILYCLTFCLTICYNTLTFLTQSLSHQEST